MGFWAVPTSYSLLAGDIEITSPPDGHTFEDGDFLEASGTCAYGGEAIVVKITLIWSENGANFQTVHTVAMETDQDEGTWSVPETSVNGPGRWKVEVYIVRLPSQNDSHDGNVNGEPI